MASQITSVSIVYSTVCSNADQRKHQNSRSLAFVKGIHWWPVNSPHKGPVTRKMFPFDDVTMLEINILCDIYRPQGLDWNLWVAFPKDRNIWNGIKLGIFQRLKPNCLKKWFLHVSKMVLTSYRNGSNTCLKWFRADTSDSKWAPMSIGKKSDNWIVRYLIFSSEFLVSC